METPEVAHVTGIEGEEEEEEDITENRMIIPLQDNYVRQHELSTYLKNTEELYAKSAIDLNVQSEPTALSSCVAQKPTSVTASNFISPNSPSKSIDNNFDTRWSNKGVGSWILLDLGSTKNICSVDVAWFMGNVRQFKFDISVSVSNDGTSFTKVRSGTSSGAATAFEKYTLPAGTEARYIRITVNGNDVTDYAAVAEIAVFGSAGTSGSCTKQPPTTISASGNDGNVPSNAVDNNLNTRWSNDGQGSWIQLDLGSKKSIC
ncbi:MAG: discoidin domain-containing protein, partial [Nitrososphaeraceae archaeon]